MVGLVFGIIFLIAGVSIGVSCFFKSDVDYARDESGRQKYDESGNIITVKTYPFRKFTVLIIIAGVILGFIVTGLGCIASVDTGHVGIVRTFGKVEDYTFDSGMHFKAPWNSVVQMDNRVQKTTIELPCFSSDIQEVNTVYTVNYQISKTNAQNLYRDVGVNYLETVVNPSIQESVNTIIAKHTAEELIKNRETLASEVEALLATNLQKYNIDVVSTAIENMDFTDSFTAAVEAKAVAAQNKLQAQIEQERLTMEAVQAAERAELEANALAEVDRIKAEAQVSVDMIKAEADKTVAEIGADTAEYQGKKEAAIALQRLASINGWTVLHNEESDINELYKANGEKVTAEELAIGTQKLIEYYYTQTWDGKLPDTFVGDGDVSNIIIGN
jgi:regulator of protease activity HflC (stomatin/prohibitin superfamily)